MKLNAPYPDLVQLSTRRVVLRSLGPELLQRTVADYGAALDTAMTVFESNGDYATGDRPYGRCRFADELSRPAAAEDAAAAIASGRWSCRASCRAPALLAMERGAPAERWCERGLRVHAAPIIVDGDVVGSISAGCPPDAEALACGMVDATARLFGEVMARKSADLDRDRARATYTGMVAHDLRQPLSAISLAVEGLLRSPATSETQGKKLQRITESTRRMSRMVEDLLDLTRAEVGAGIPLRRQRLSLAELAEEIVDDQRRANPGHAVQVRALGDTTLDCDADRLREVIENLVVNAIRHGQGSPVDVLVDGSQAHEVVLLVHNGGPTIPADALPSIFDPFTQGKVRSTQGLGLGLHIACELVRAHGGAIEARSSDEAGTVFSARLPRDASTPA